jgi:predicted TIM-barrel fold metal-dependent hydrolase
VGPGPVWDVDVLTVPREPRIKPVPRPAEIVDELAARGVRRALRADTTASSLDAGAANERIMAAEDPSGVAVGIVGIDLRDPVGALRELDRWQAGHDARLGRDVVRVWANGATGTAARLVLERAAAAGYVVLLCGEFRSCEPLVRGLGADVVFLDTHFYQLGDFLVAARDEAGYRTSTRLLNSPDGLETVVAELGAGRMLFGSGAPDFEPLVPMLRLAHARIGDAERHAVAWQNAAELFQAEVTA